MKKSLALIGIYAFPFVALAQTTDIPGLIGVLQGILNTLVPFIIGLAFIWFIWGVFRYVTAEGPENKEKARDIIIFGLLGLFVIVSVWGLVNVLTGSFGIETGGTLEQRDIPGVPGTPSGGSLPFVPLPTTIGI